MISKQETPHHPARRQVQELQHVVEDLQARLEEVKAERNRLQEENRRLRRELTHARLADDLLRSLKSMEDGLSTVSDDVPTATRLYRTLPDECSFPFYFQAAEDLGLDMVEARRCLQHFLGEDLLEQTGTRLAKANGKSDSE